MDPQHGLDELGAERSIASAEAVGDPCRLCPSFEVSEILIAATAVHRDDRDESPAGHEPDEQQPPLEFRHQAGRIGPAAAAGGGGPPAYTRPS